MNDLVKRLTQEQEVEASLRPEPTVPALKAAIDRNYVNIKFPNTRGGTELGIPLDHERSDVKSADFEKGTGSVHIVGVLTLDYTKVRFHGTIDLSTLKGTGYLEPLEDVG
jgi:core binding factor beta subunit